MSGVRSGKRVVNSRLVQYYQAWTGRRNVTPALPHPPHRRDSAGPVLIDPLRLNKRPVPRADEAPAYSWVPPVRSGTVRSLAPQLTT